MLEDFGKLEDEKKLEIVKMVKLEWSIYYLSEIIKYKREEEELIALMARKKDESLEDVKDFILKHGKITNKCEKLIKQTFNDESLLNDCNVYKMKEILDMDELKDVESISTKLKRMESKKFMLVKAQARKLNRKLIEVDMVM